MERGGHEVWKYRSERGQSSSPGKAEPSTPGFPLPTSPILYPPGYLLPYRSNANFLTLLRSNWSPCSLVSTGMRSTARARGRGMCNKPMQVPAKNFNVVRAKIWSHCGCFGYPKASLRRSSGMANMGTENRQREFRYSLKKQAHGYVGDLAVRVRLHLVLYLVLLLPLLECL